MSHVEPRFFCLTSQTSLCEMHKTGKCTCKACKTALKYANSVKFLSRKKKQTNQKQNETIFASVFIILLVGPLLRSCIPHIYNLYLKALGHAVVGNFVLFCYL